jgi:Ca2+-binding EF-hand superfamily protein
LIKFEKIEKDSKSIEKENINDYDKLKNISDIKDNSNDMKNFQNFLKILLEGENKIENMKIELCNNKEFNVEDTFRLFEKNGRGFLDIDDLKYGLGVLNLYPSEFNMKLFMKRYDLQNKGYITFADFFDIVVPFELKIREDVEKRIPKSNCPKIILSREIINSLKKLFKYLIEFETRVNIERKSVNINVKEVFNIFDNNSEGFFYFPNFITYITNYGLLDDNINPDLLYIRMDKNRNGRIDFKEFVDEMVAI